MLSRTFLHSSGEFARTAERSALGSAAWLVLGRQVAGILLGTGICCTTMDSLPIEPYSEFEGSEGSEGCEGVQVECASSNVLSEDRGSRCAVFLWDSIMLL